MNEAAWLSCADPDAMIEFVRDRASKRKLRLFICGCCRSIWHLLIDNRSRTAVEIMERYADGEATWDDGIDACRMNEQVFDEFRSNPVVFDPALAVGCLFDYLGPKWGAERVSTVIMEAAGSRQLAAAGAVCSDIFGNPFRPAAFGFAWRTPEVTNLARSIYDDRAFNRMPELADALNKAGCHDTDLLTHCRELREHVRGCWVVDLVLGKQ